MAPQNDWTGSGVPVVQWYCDGDIAQDWQYLNGTNSSAVFQK